MERKLMDLDTQAWRMQVWLSFGLALALTTVGVLYLPVDIWVKGYLGVGLYFTVSSCFTLAKTLRDQHEREKVTNQISEARTERMLREYGEEAA
ncbi:MAG: hypothetical protein JRH01_04445 [Deltaproteobacteria bacterium]|nr:hypothetical protein [Deltaproteobacteria bacterium]MBW2394125.1 hypothetical protein [Deltaproteobacteria bacterium]